MFRRLMHLLVPRAPAHSDEPTSWIDFTRDGFTLHTGDSAFPAVPWTDVSRIVAFKRDFGTSDVVCLEFLLSSGAFEVNDDVGGFWDLVQRVKDVFPESEQEWEEQVVQPAFAENRTLIYQRIEAHGGS